LFCEFIGDSADACRSDKPELLFRITQLKYYVAASKAVMEKLGGAALSMGRVIRVGEEQGKGVCMYEDPSGSRTFCLSGR
jgi:hypothetical protein